MGFGQQLHEKLSKLTAEQLRFLIHVHRRGREYNLQRAAEVRNLRFDG
jgi:hypothetical protein